MLRIAPSLLRSISRQVSQSEVKRLASIVTSADESTCNFRNTMVRFSRDVVYLQNFKCPRTSNRKTCAYYLLHVVIPFQVKLYKMMMLCIWRIGIDKKGTKIGVYFTDVKNTHECYMTFENVCISHTFVIYWYEIRDILVPILHARWRIGTNYSRCEIYEVWNLRYILFVLNFTIANTVISKEPHFRLYVCSYVIYV